jgi:hypothetical protein
VHSVGERLRSFAFTAGTFGVASDQLARCRC